MHSIKGQMWSVANVTCAVRNNLPYEEVCWWDADGIIRPVVSVSELTWFIIVETKLKLCNVQYYNDYIYVLGFEQI